MQDEYVFQNAEVKVALLMLSTQLLVLDKCQMHLQAGALGSSHESRPLNGPARARGRPGLTLADRQRSTSWVRVALRSGEGKASRVATTSWAAAVMSLEITEPEGRQQQSHWPLQGAGASAKCLQQPLTVEMCIWMQQLECTMQSKMALTGSIVNNLTAR